MCGICGKFDFEQNANVSRSLIGSMLDTIRHRGPDDEGIYLSPGLGLGHARLSIIDLVQASRVKIGSNRRHWLRSPCTWDSAPNSLISPSGLVRLD